MDRRTRRRGTNTVTVQHNLTPPHHIPRIALVVSFVAVIIAIVTHFTRTAVIPQRTIPSQDPTVNITSVSDLIRLVFDAPQRGHFFRTGCLSRRSLLCHSLQHVSHVLDDVSVFDEGDSYVFRITKEDVLNMRQKVLLRREILDGCTPWQHGTFFMKVDWLLLHYIPRTIASRVFGTSFTEGGFRRDRWGWCAETIPFGNQRTKPSPVESTGPSEGHQSPPGRPFPGTSSNDQSNHEEEGSAFRDTSNPLRQSGHTNRDDSVQQGLHQRQNIMYAR